MTRYIHVDRIGPGTCAVTARGIDNPKAIDVCGCLPFDGVEPIEDEDGWSVCVYCGHEVRELMSDELIEALA